MKNILLLVGFALCGLTACNHKFELANKNFIYFGEVSDPAAAQKLCLWPEGYYLTKICRYETSIDGQPITAYRSCPTCPVDSLEVDSLDKTAFFVFLDEKRVVYYSREAVFATKNQTRKRNNPSEVEYDFATRTNKKGNFMRGYYQIVPMPDEPEACMIKMHLERKKGMQVFINLRFEADRMTIYEVGRFDDEGFRRNQIPPMVRWDEVFRQPLDFYCDTTSHPRLLLHEKPFAQASRTQFNLYELPW
jgi:hypothetical protein